MAKPLEPFPDFSDEPLPDEPIHRTGTPRQRRLPTLPIVISVIIVLLGAGGAVYWFLIRHHRTTPQAQSTGTASQSPTPPAVPPAAPSSSTTGQYTSNGQDLNLTFTYPTDWAVAPASGNNSSDQPITITSPPAGTTNSAGKAVTGRVIVSIRPGSAQLSELASGSATVAQDSVQFGYSKPTATQHQYPYLTYVRLGGGADAANGFDEVIITGITKFTKGQNLSVESLAQLDPIISARFYTCAASCSGSAATALAITPSTWQNSAPFTQIQALFESLQLH